MRTRRKLLTALGAVAFGAPFRTLAQPAKMPLVAYASPVVPQNNTDWRFEAFRQGMRELGYVEGKNLRLEVRWGEGKLERLPDIAAEIVRLKPDVIVASSIPTVMAARDATRTIPIVMPVSSDPVSDGLVASLARPGGNITGLSLMAPELGAKRLQYLKEVLPRSRAVGVMWNPAYKGMRARFDETQSVASAIGVDIRSIELTDPRQMEAAFQAVARARPDGLLLLADPLTISMRARIIEFARESSLPAIYETREFVEAGGLMSYGPNIEAQYRRAAYYVDRILKGAKASELPIELPTKIELVVNLRTARALGISVPKSILINAERVIE